MHTLIWFLWAFGLMAVALSTRNPLYLVLLVLIVCTVREALPKRRSGISIIRFALFAVPASALFNALSMHFGEAVLFTIPGNLPVFSGPVTLEALAYGAINGLILTVVLAVFDTLNRALSPREWMRLAPRSYQSVGMTMSIALSLLPQTSRRIRDVREAQAIRGHRVRGLRDWLPLWMPLLTGGLEQSMQLSEAMVARGFGATQAQQATSARQVLLAGGLALVGAGAFARMIWPTLDLAAMIAMAIGAACAVIGILRSSRAVRPTSLRDQRLTAADVICMLILCSALAVVLLPPLLGRATSLAYTPYPALTPPSFDLAVGAALLAFLTPLLLLAKFNAALVSRPDRL
jgi:energy-coupling factor transport system permease protein